MWRFLLGLGLIVGPSFLKKSKKKNKLERRAHKIWAYAKPDQETKH